MSAIAFGVGGPASAMDFTFWYGLAPTPRGIYFPTVAYHPSLKRNHEVPYEARRMLSKYGRTEGLQGTPLPPSAPASSRYSNIKLWGRWSHRGLHLSVCQCNLGNPDIIGHEIISQFVDSDLDYFRQFVREVEQNRGLLLTLLDDELNVNFAALELLVEWYSFEEAP